MTRKFKKPTKEKSARLAQVIADAYKKLDAIEKRERLLRAKGIDGVWVQWL